MKGSVSAGKQRPGMCLCAWCALTGNIASRLSECECDCEGGGRGGENSNAE